MYIGFVQHSVSVALSCFSPSLFLVSVCVYLKRTLFEFKFDRTHGLKVDDAAEATLFFVVVSRSFRSSIYLLYIIRETSGERAKQTRRFNSIYFSFILVEQKVNKRKKKNSEQFYDPNVSKFNINSCFFYFFSFSIYAHNRYI